jgi:hypothetical protein
VEAKTTINYLLVEDKWCHPPPEGTVARHGPARSRGLTGIFDIAGVGTCSHIRKGRDVKSTVFHIALSDVLVPFEGKPPSGAA